MRQLVTIGGLLCGVKAVQYAAAGILETAVKTIEGARRLLADVEQHADQFPNVTLPSGVTLVHALACVKIVADLIAGETEDN